MKGTDSIERLLGQTPAPRVVEGSHRDQLKQRLLESSETAQPGSHGMWKSLLGRMSLTTKLAAALMVAAVLFGTAWAAEEVYNKFIGGLLVLEETPVQTIESPDGATACIGGVIVTNVDPNEPNAIETARRHHEEMKQLVAEKKYRFLSTFQDTQGQTQYVYQFTYADGTQGGMNFSMPLDNVISWDDYRQKVNEQARQRLELTSGQTTKLRHYEEMKQLIAEGEYEFVSTFHDPQGRIQYIYRFTYADGSRSGMNFSIPLENVTSWDDYLWKANEQAE